MDATTTIHSPDWHDRPPVPGDYIFDDGWRRYITVTNCEADEFKRYIRNDHPRYFGPIPPDPRS